MELVNGLRNAFRSEYKRWVFLVGLVAVTHLLFQSFLLPYGNALRSLLPADGNSLEGYGNVVLRVQSSSKSAMVRNPLTINASDISTRDVVVFNNVMQKDGSGSDFNGGGDVGNGSRIMGDRGEIESGSASEGTNEVVVDRNVDDDYASENGEDLNEFAVLNDVIRDQDDYVNTASQTPTLESGIVSSVTMESTDEAGNGFTIEQVAKHGQEVSTGKLRKDKTSEMANLASTVTSSMANQTSNAGSSISSTSLQSDNVASEKSSSMIAKPGKKKMRCEMPPKSVTTIDQMNRLLVRHRRSSRAAVIFIFKND